MTREESINLGLSGTSAKLVDDPAGVGDERRLTLVVNGRAVTTVELLRFYVPRHLVSHNRLFVWGGTRLYVIDCNRWEARRIDREDEVHGVFPLNELVCIQGETSVSVFDPVRAVDVRRYLHDEIIVEARKEANTLLLRDLRDRAVQLDLDAIPPFE